MTDASIFIFATSTALLLAMPGPTNALFATAGAAGGPGNAGKLIGAALAGYAIVLALLLSLDEIAGSLRGEIGLALRAAAAVILIATAWRMWRNAGISHGLGKQHGTPGAGNIFLLTLFNPKALIFGFAIFPPVVAEGAIVPAVALFFVIAMVAGLGWIGLGAATRKLPGRPQVVVIRLSSLVVAGFACYFAALVAAELMPLTMA